MEWMMLAAALAVSGLCDRPAPEPRAYAARGFGVVAEIFPPGSRQNPGERPVAYVYEVGYPGPRWDVDARRLWSAALPHDRFPAEAVVSRAGHLVTLDDYDDPGAANAVVVVGPEGAGRAFALHELLARDEIAALERSDCGIRWRDGARYFFLLDTVPRLHIALAGGLVLEIGLDDGRLRRGPVADFPGLVRVMERPHPNEEAAVWMTSLRFSSLTDALAGGQLPARGVVHHPRPTPRAAVDTTCPVPLGEPGSGPLGEPSCAVAGVDELGMAAGRRWLAGRYVWTGMPAEEEWDDPVAYDQVVLFRSDPGDPAWIPVWRRETDRRFELIHSVRAASRPEGLLVELLVCLNGTGGCAREHLLASERLRSVRPEYADSLRALLPPGATLHKGMTVDLATLEGVWPVAAPGDANCCPSLEMRFRARLDGAVLRLIDAELREREEPR